MSNYHMFRSRNIFLLCNVLFLTLLAMTMIVPFLNVLAVSFSTDLESYENTIKLFPKTLSLSGYVNLFRRVAILTPLLNNTFVTVIGTLSHVLLCSMAGFVLIRSSFPGKSFVVLLVTIPMMIPFQMIIIPVYVTMKKIGLIDTLWSLILIDIVSTFSIFLMKNYFEGIPRSLEESAIIEGANEWIVFSKVYLPLAKPGIATIAIFQFVSRWNHFLPAVLFINSTKKYTLQIALKSLVVSSELTSTTQSVANNARMAGIVVSVIPLLIVYIFAQRYFTTGIMVGSVKE
ncbi:carbohydrate ABC transporter permease [Sediminispirochaeta smaragdinae]|uniref:sn-glycerol-3-phosphate transport system permease protein UgpE n=1 Tax=Sediminispirochaeta smaragdinae (strain DSM 11293 / JCM 15392 / SEBR 4228) TaxID=573413 RepID=E1R2S3_SEDSS|nr:carbohydrate ABC transporter permease [Sediminispirochaeta smaragdinae]ADK80355.1 binding-protein-dependent transport systems inner membrane component [Sediminispirochaeta smaragdinae DSM 11293]